MEVLREQLNPCTVELTVKIDPDTVRSGFDRAAKRLSKDIRIPGFRPGHAPKHMVEQAIRAEALYDAAAEILIKDGFSKALKQEDLQPHSQPSVEVTALNKDEEIREFKAKVPLPPQIELSSYKGLAIKKPRVTVTDGEVGVQLDEIRKRDGKRIPITERGIQDGDSAVLNIKVDGEEGDGRNFMIIAGKTFKELDGALTGMKADEIKSLDLKFPKSFQEKDWAGKDHHVHIAVRSISAVQAPEIDAEFLSNFGSESLDELKIKLREAILAAKESMSIDYANEQILETVLKESTIHVPDTMWEQVASRRLNDLAAEQQQKGKSMEDYAKDSGMTIQELVDAWKNEAKLHVQRAVVVQKIFEIEKLELTNEDFNRELHVMAQEYNADPKELLAAMQKQKALQELQFRSVFRKVTDFMRQHAVIEEFDLDNE
jgi:trigger factor